MKDLYSGYQNQEYINHTARLIWDNLIATISLRICQEIDLSTILQAIVDEVRQLIECDRVLFYRFFSDGSGKVVFESVSSPEFSLIDRVVQDSCFESNWLKPYQEGKFSARDDIADVTDISQCHAKFLASFQVRANLVVPVLSKSQLWGFLIANNCTAPHQWLPEEINGLQQIAVHIGIAIYQADLLEQLQSVKAEMEVQAQARKSELKEANRQVLQSEATNRALIRAIPDFLVRMRRDGVQKEVINSGSIHYPHPASEISSICINDLMPLEVRQERIRLADIATATGQIQKQEYHFVDRGETYYEEARIVPIGNEDVLVAVSDITDRKLSEIALKQSESRFLEISESSPNVIYIYVQRSDGSIYFEHISRAIEDIMGIPVEQILENALTMLDRIHPDDLAEYAAALQLSRETLQPFRHEWRMIAASGEIKWVQGNSRPKPRANGDIAWYGVVIDIGIRKRAEFSLQQIEAQQQAILEAMPDLLLRVNRDGFCLDFMAPPSTITDRFVPIKRHLSELLPPDLLQRQLRAIKQAIAINELQLYNHQLQKFGKIAYEEVRITRINDNEALVIVRDITERKQAEIALRASEIKLREAYDEQTALFSAMPDVVLIRNKEGRCIKIVPTNNQKLLGTPEEVLSRSIYEELPQPAANIIMMAIRESLNTQKITSCDYSLEIHGREIWFEANISPIDEDKVIQLSRDITERKLAELALKQSEASYRHLIDNLHAGFMVHATDTSILFCNAKACDLLGLSLDQLMGKVAIEPDWHFSREDGTVMPLAEYPVNQVLSNGMPLINYVLRINRSDRTKVWVLVNAFPEFDSHQKLQQIAITLIDISDRKQAELALQESESRFQKIALSSPGVIYILVRQLDGSICFEYVSSAFKDIFGITAEQVLEDFNIYKNLIHPEDRLGYQEAVTYSTEHLSPFEHKWRIITPLQKLKWVQARSRPECQENGTIAWHGVLLDITDQMEGEQRLTQIAYHIPGMIYQYRLRTDGSSHFPYSSDGIRDIYGVSPEQVKEDASLAFQVLHPDDLAYITKSIDESAANLTPWYCEYRVCRENGQFNWVFGHATPQKEIDGSIIWNGYITDISERKQTEIALAEAKEVAEAATKSKSQFLANMSHEIRTPMNGVLGMTELLANTNLTEEQQDIVQTIRDSGDILLVVINDILDFSKIESGMLQLEEHLFVLKDLLASACNLLNKQALVKDTVLQYVISPDIPTNVIGDSTRIGQILLNLIGNAIKFTQNGSINIFITKNEIQDKQKLELTISIKDSGIGIDCDRIDKLFQPFTQADDSISRRYGGTGLGLAISKSLIELMDGTIWVESLGNIGGSPPSNWTSGTAISTNQGSNFYFTIVLKVVPETKTTSQIAASDSKQNANIDTSQLKILLAEDNLFNQKVATMMLKKLGYVVDIANNGLEVLEKVENQSYALILMDMQMPEMDGVTVTKIIRQSNKPQPWIIALTANALEEDRQICFDSGMNDFISKPIAINELQRIMLDYLPAK